MDLMVGWMSKRCDRINDLMDVLYVCTYGYMNVWMTLWLYNLYVCMNKLLVMTWELVDVEGLFNT